MIKNSPVRFKYIKRFENELKWVKLLQTPSPFGFNYSIYHEGNISKMPDVDIFLLLEFRKRKSRSHGKRKKGNEKRKRYTAMKSNTSLNIFSTRLREHGRHAMLSFLSPLSLVSLVSSRVDVISVCGYNFMIF